MTETKKPKETLPKGAVMSAKVAEKELEKWHDYRRVKESKRNNVDEDLGYDLHRSKLIEAFEYGELIFDSETGVLKQVLQFPVNIGTSGDSIKELNFTPRQKRNALIEPMKGVKSSDSEGRTKAWISAVTGTDKLRIGTLDFADFSLSEAIVMYFLT